MQKMLKELIDEIFRCNFKQYGWKKRGLNYRYVDESGLGRVINFQRSRWNRADDIEIFINYGLYIEVENELVNKVFKEYECQFSARTRFNGGRYRFNADTCIEEARKQLERALEEATDLFAKVENKEMFVSLLLSGELKKYSVNRIMDYYTCKLLSDMGYHEEIYDIVKTKGGPYFEALAVELEAKLKC
ncbi:MAG: DUF4304 domain-containing protein [Peptostreptococcaceae bacterium]|nr:DUF4304 domain-containing protein [Peptostreptococcaceae bacterium]